MRNIIFAATAASVVIAGLGAGPAFAQKKKEAAVQLVSCPASYGSIAIVDGDTQGWTKFGLGSPRDMIAAMAAQSGCFTLHDAASGRPADFLMNAIAGDKEEVNRGVEVAKTALIEGAVRSGAIGQLAGNVPVLGGMLGMFGGLGGKKKTVAAGLRVINPATGQTIVAGSGEAKKSSISFGGFGGANPYAAAARQHMVANGYGEYAGAYTNSKDGKMLTSAFIQAFNGVVAQAGALSAVKAARP